MPTYTVKKGDTMWGIVSRDLEKRKGRKPTNAEINRALKAARAPRSGDKNKIKPGDKITLSYTAGGGSEPRGAEKSNRKQTTQERFRDLERAPKKKAPSAGARAAGAADRYGSGGKPGRKVNSGARAASAADRYGSGGKPGKKTSTTKKSVKKAAPAGSSAARWGKSQGAVQRGIRKTRANQQSRLNKRKASSDRAFAEQQARARAKMKKRYPGA